MRNPKQLRNALAILIAGACIAPATLFAQFIYPVSGSVPSGGQFGDCRDGCARRHEGLDIAGSTGTLVGAGYSGTASFVGVSCGLTCGYGRLVILNHPSGYQTYYGHLDSFIVSNGQSVSKNQDIARRGNTGGSTGPHVHYEIRRDGTPLFIPGTAGQSISRNAAIPNSYPGLSSPAPEYLGVLYQDGLFAAKEGLYGGWFNQLGGVSAIQMNGNRLGALAGGAVYVKEGLQGGWTTQTPGGAASFQLHGNRIGVLYNNGIMSAKDGLYGAWYDQLGGVSAFQLEGNRIGVVAGGALYVKEGLQGGWTTQTASGVAKFQMSGDRIGVLYTSGLVSCKDGLYGSWFNQLSGCSDFHLHGDRIGVIAGGAVYVKEGLQGSWTTQTASGASRLQLHGNRIAVLYSNGILSAKDGLYGAWFDQRTGVTSFQLQGDRIGSIAGGIMSLKIGLQGGWVNQTGPTAASFQLNN